MGSLAPLTIEIHGAQLGNALNLIAISGESFTSLGASIQAASPLPTWEMGYADGYIGYLPDQDAFDGGTCEALASPYERGVADVVTTPAGDLSRSLEKPLS